LGFYESVFNYRFQNPSMPYPSEHVEIDDFLKAKHPGILKLGMEDMEHEQILRGVQDFFTVPDFFPIHSYYPLLLATARATGMALRAPETIPDYLNRALRGKTVAVIGTRYGSLQKLFGAFGAKTYGIDINDEAAKVARSRGLAAVTGDVANIHSLFPDREPDFIVSFQFFDPSYWQSRKEQLPHILEGILEHSTESTIHVHCTDGNPTAFPNFDVLSQESVRNLVTTVLKKKI
jgi:hypothetical protein